MALGMVPINQTNRPIPHPSQLSPTNQSATSRPSLSSTPKPITNLASITSINHKPIADLASITIITPKPITNLASITIINPKPITRPRIHHKYQPQTNHRIYICSYKTNTDIADLSDILGKCYQANQRYPYFHQYRPRGNRANPYATPEALYRGVPPWRR